MVVVVVMVMVVVRGKGMNNQLESVRGSKRRQTA